MTGNHRTHRSQQTGRPRHTPTPLGAPERPDPGAFWRSIPMPTSAHEA